MDNSKNLPGWQPTGAPGAAPQLGFENMAHESQPMNPPPYQGPMNPPPYQSQYPGQPGYPQSQPGYQHPYPQQQPGYANPYPPQPQNGFQNPYPNQPQNGFENPHPVQPGANQNPYPNNQQLLVVPRSDYQADQFIDDESERRSNGKEKKKHKKFLCIIGAVVVIIAVTCIGIAVYKWGSDSSSDKKAEPEKRQKTTEKPKSKPDKFVTENCTLIMNLYKFLKCSDLKNCKPTIDGTATDESTEVTIDVTPLIKCSMVIFCNGALSCGDNLNITILSTDSTSSSDVSRKIVYRRPYSSMIPIIIPIPIPQGGGMFRGNKQIGKTLKKKIVIPKIGKKG